MKKIIGIIFVSLMFANIGFAEMRLIEKDNWERKHGSKEEFAPKLYTVCIDNYKFAVTKFHEGLSMVQFYEAGNNQSPKPAKC